MMSAMSSRASSGSRGPYPRTSLQISSSRSSCSEIDITIDLSAMISATMSRISSRAASWSMVASWLRSIESIRALKIADLVWKYSLSRWIASAERTSTISSLRRRFTAASTTGLGTSTRAGTGAVVTTPIKGALGCGRGASAAPGVFPPKERHKPNISGLLELQQRTELQAAAPRLGCCLGRGTAGHVHADHAEDLIGPVVRRDLGEHLAVVCSRPERRRVEGDLAEQLALNRCRELLGCNLGPLGHTKLVDHQQRLSLIGPKGLHRVGEILGVAEVGEIRLGDDDDFVDGRERMADPGGPVMRDVQHHHRGGLLRELEHLFKIALAIVERLVEHGRRSQQVDVIGGLAHQTVEHGGIDLARGAARH